MTLNTKVRNRVSVNSKDCEQSLGCLEMGPCAYPTPRLNGMYPMIRDSGEEREQFCQNFFFELVVVILQDSMFFRKFSLHPLGNPFPSAFFNFLFVPLPFFFGWFTDLSCPPLSSVAHVFKCAYVYKDNRANAKGQGLVTWVRVPVSPVKGWKKNAEPLSLSRGRKFTAKWDSSNKIVIIWHGDGEISWPLSLNTMS